MRTNNIFLALVILLFTNITLQVYPMEPFEDEDEIENVQVPIHFYLALTNNCQEIEALLTKYAQLGIDLGLINTPVILSSYDPSTIQTMINIASQNGNVDMVKLLIKHGALIDVCDGSGWTALHHACIGGQTLVVNLLLNEKADLYKLTDTKKTALHLACYTRYVNYIHLNGKFKNIVQLLLDASQTKLINARDALGCTPLHIASGNSIDYVENLIKYAKNNNILDMIINAQDSEGLTPLHMACIKQNSKIVGVLLNNHADVNIMTTKLVTPLHIACDNGNLDCVKLLLDHHAKTNVKNIVGATSLHVACKRGYVKIVKALLKAGADVNATTNPYTKVTPLHEACAYGHSDVACLLMEYKADPMLCSIKGKELTALGCARTNGHHALANLLQSLRLEKPNANFYTNETCSICMDKFKDRSVCAKLCCGHIFHASCLKNWKLKTCPLCRNETNIDDQSARCKQLLIFDNTLKPVVVRDEAESTE